MPAGAALKTRVWLEFKGGAALGAGRVELLEAVDRHGSITVAARAMGVSYRAAWRWISCVNQAAGAPLVVTATGGARGGGARLSPLGKAAVLAYRMAESRLAKTGQALNGQIARMIARAKGREP